MKKVYIGLKDLDHNVVSELIHDNMMRELCHLSVISNDNDNENEDGDDDNDAIVTTVEALKASGAPILWITTDVRAAVTSDARALEQMLREDFRLSTVRTAAFRPDMSAAEAELYDAVLCASEEECDRLLALLPAKSVVALSLERDCVTTAPVSGIDWHVDEEGPHRYENPAEHEKTAAAVRRAVWTAIDVVRNRLDWREEHANPLPKLFVEKKGKKDKDGGAPKSNDPDKIGEE
jgi:hypothetical protein